MDAKQRPPVVLVADDEPGQRLLLRETLAQHDYQVVEAANGIEAIARFEEFLPDLLLLDVMMPEMGGFDVCKILRGRPEGRHVPIVMVTGLDDTDSIHRAYEIGATDFMTKPINWSLLVQQVRYILRGANNERLLRKAMRAAEAASRAKSGFLATMSHELRTPLNAIIGFSEVIMASSTVDNASKGYAADIHQSGRHLHRIIGDILDIAQIDADEVTVQFAPMDVGRALQSVVSEAQQSAAEADITFDADLPPDPMVIAADERRFKQVIEAVLSNAVKFTPAGGRISFKASLEDDDFRIVCSDTGIGIPTDQLDLITQPFYQVDSRLSRTHEGSGLGLAIVKAFVAAWGGTLDLKSSVDGGTTVTIHHPAEMASPALQAAS
jgi:signal transduction histidine kinase